jgi:hypothetical protein
MLSCQWCIEDHPVSCPMGTRISQGRSGWGMKVTTHLHLVLRLRICGVIIPLPQYVFMAWCLVKHRDNFIFTFAKWGKIIGSYTS